MYKEHENSHLGWINNPPTISFRPHLLQLLTYPTLVTQGSALSPPWTHGTVSHCQGFTSLLLLLMMPSPHTIPTWILPSFSLASSNTASSLDSSSNFPKHLNIPLNDRHPSASLLFMCPVLHQTVRSFRLEHKFHSSPQSPSWWQTQMQHRINAHWENKKMLDTSGVSAVEKD